MSELQRPALPGLSRRAMLRQVAAVSLAATLPKLAWAKGDGAPASASAVLNYLETLARPDGGYAWADQEQSHLTPTFAVIGVYHVLGQMPPHRTALAQFVRSHHPHQLKAMEQEHREFEFQQIQSLVWLGEDASSFSAQVSGWKEPTVYLKQYEQHGWPILRHEVTAFTCRALLGLSLGGLSAHYLEYLASRRRANGSFNNTPASDGSEGHVLNSWWGLSALSALGRLDELKADTVAWLRACQLPGGGFTYQPKPEFGGLDDAAYTWAAVSSLRLLGAEPAQPQACVAYLQSLANADGGYGDRPGWASNPLATYYALNALQALGALESGLSKRPKQRAPRRELPKGLKVFSIQLEAHGQGSPAEAVDLARALKIHLWGAKNAKPEWLAQAQAEAERQAVPVKFFVANEEYGTWVTVPGLGTYSHTSDLMAPAATDFGAALSGQGSVSWEEFRHRRLEPLQRAGGRLLWQFGENEELVRLFLDDSLVRGGYGAISTFHFGNPDFFNTEPFLQRYRGQIPFVALQDAHGAEPWWFADMTSGFRTVFLASEPTWEGWLKALEHNWVVAIRHDAVSRQQTWMHGGSSELLEFVRQHELDWRWWDNPAIERPMVSLVVLKPEARLEAGRPEKGVALRVRCAWENTAQGLPKKPIAELVSLSADGVQVVPELVTTKAARGNGRADFYHRFELAEPKVGAHSATVVVRVLERKATLSRTVSFEV